MPTAAAPMTPTTATPTATIRPVDAPAPAVVVAVAVDAPADAPPDAPPAEPPDVELVEPAELDAVDVDAEAEPVAAPVPAEPVPAPALPAPVAAAAPPIAAAPAANMTLAGMGGGLMMLAAEAQLAPAAAAWTAVRPATPPNRCRPKALVALGLPPPACDTSGNGLVCFSSSSVMSSPKLLVSPM